MRISIVLSAVAVLTLVGFATPAFAGGGEEAAEAQPAATERVWVPARREIQCREVVIPARTRENCTPVYEDVEVPVYERQCTPRYRTVEVAVYARRALSRAAARAAA